MIIPAQYDDATPFVNGRAIIEQCGTPDIIDDRGNSLLIENDIFDLIWISDTNKDLYIGRMDSSGEAYYITSEGNLICPYTPWSDSVYEYLDVED